MYQTVIVPLDGSSFAAQAVSTAVEIARRSSADLVLTRVHETYAYEDMDYSMAEDTSRRDQEEDLAEIAAAIDERYGLQAERRLLTGAVVPALCTFASELAQPLIVMSTHGRTGFSRVWLGSIADAVARHSPAPVLMLRHHATRGGVAAKAHPFKTILVPLDGSHLSEIVLPHAVGLATAFGSRLSLVRVVTSVRSPASAPAVSVTTGQESLDNMLESRMHGAEHYLDQIAAHLWLEDTALDVTTSVRASDAAAPALLESAGQASADTIALATNGRGASRLLVPSVADKILRGGPEAVLIVRASESSESESWRQG